MDWLAFQKESFWVAKGVLFECKRSPFEVQKGSFSSAKGVLLQNGCFPMALQGLNRGFSDKRIEAFQTSESRLFRRVNQGVA